MPLSSAETPTPTYLKLLSADVIHSFWVPQLSGKIDLIPNNLNEMWIDPLHTGMYVGQCAQFCGVQHAKMLLRVYVDTPEQFAAWVKNQQQVAVSDESVAAGRHVFETQACMNCHTIRGTAATGTLRARPHAPDEPRHAGVGRDGQHARRTCAQWIRHPDTFKEGALMPAMQLNDQQLDQVTAYLATLK